MRSTVECLGTALEQVVASWQRVERALNETEQGIERRDKGELVRPLVFSLHKRLVILRSAVLAHVHERTKGGIVFVQDALAVVIVVAAVNAVLVVRGFRAG